MSSLGDRIKSLRKENNLTQSDLGEKLNVGKSTISQYESDKSTPNDDIKKMLAEMFQVSLDYLMGNSDIRNYTEKLSSAAAPSIDSKDNSLFITFGSRLKKLREDGKLTVDQLSEIINVSSDDINNLEKGLTSPNEQILKEIADYFKVTFDYLFGRTDNSKGKIYEFNVGGHNIKAIVEEPDNNIDEEEFKRELLQKLIKEYL